jgi:hypothetical protein
MKSGMTRKLFPRLKRSLKQYPVYPTKNSHNSAQAIYKEEPIETSGSLALP